MKQISIQLASAPSPDYDVRIGQLPSLHFSRKVALITNPKVGGLHLKRLLEAITADELYVITVPDGEAYKNFETVEWMLDRLFDHRLDRKSLLIAFGGGVIGDMTGFCAAIFQRGIDFIQVPTTLLSQVDASVGGKTGINNRYGKNLVGSFNQPKAVYIDTAWLETLPKREFAAGVAEIIKMAVMFDVAFFEWLESHPLEAEENLAYAIARSVELKAEVVRKDEKEQGIRAVLNYGHTFAHVIENFSGYGNYLHGEAVAIGMVMANRLACTMNLLEASQALRIEKLLERYGLPTTYRIESADRFYEAFFLDKKSQNNRLTFILPDGLGNHRIDASLGKAPLIDLLALYERSPHGM